MLLDKGFKPKGDVIIETVVDEEYAGGNGSLAGRMRGYNTDFAIDLEPTCLDICPACVGAIILKITVNGKGGMPYTGAEVQNPSYDIADILQRVREYGKKREKETVAPAAWDNAMQKAQVIVTKVKSGEAYKYGQLSVPQDAWCEVIIQYYPGEDENVIVKDFTKFIKHGFRNSGLIQVSSDYRFCLAATNDAEHIGIKTLQKCIAQNGNASDGIVRAAMFSCDLGMFVSNGVPTVVFGPKGDNLHSPDEWVEIQSMETCTKGIADFIVEWCG